MLRRAVVALVLFAPRANYGAEPTTGSSSHQPINRAEALRIAEQDAKHAYRDLTLFRVEANEEADGWHVDYVLRNPNLDGGGPHYVIDRRDGHIISKRYEQ
jgi:hypothetical protein